MAPAPSPSDAIKQRPDLKSWYLTSDDGATLLFTHDDFDLVWDKAKILHMNSCMYRAADHVLMATRKDYSKADAWLAKSLKQKE